MSTNDGPVTPLWVVMISTFTMRAAGNTEEHEVLRQCNDRNNTAHQRVHEENETAVTWTLDERPLIVLLFGAKTGVENHLTVVCSANSHWSPGGPFSAVPSPCVTGVVAPATARLLQALSTGS